MRWPGYTPPNDIALAFHNLCEVDLEKVRVKSTEMFGDGWANKEETSTYENLLAAMLAAGVPVPDHLKTGQPTQ